MDWKTYAELSHEPCYFTRWALVNTQPYLESAHVQFLQAAMLAEPLSKPLGHKGGAETDVFKLELSHQTTDSVLHSLECAIVQPSNESAQIQRKLRGLIQKWSEYKQFLSEL